MKKVNFLDISMAYWINIFVKFEISVFIREKQFWAVYKNYVCIFYEFVKIMFLFVVYF